MNPINPADDDMTVPTYEREETPVLTPRPGARFALRGATTPPPIGAVAPRGAAARLGIGTSSNARAARLGIGSGLASRAARLGLGAPIVPVVDPDEEKSA